MSKTAVVSVTATVPAESDARALAINTGTPVPSTAPAAPSAASEFARSLLKRYISSRLTGPAVAAQ
jgi:hypothetical protein